MRNIFQTWRPTNFKLGAQTETRITNKRRDLQLQGQGCKVTWRVWQVLADTSKTKRPGNTKIGGKVADSTGNNTHHAVSRSKVKDTRLTKCWDQTGRPTNVKIATLMEHALSTATASYNGLWSWVLARGRGHTVVLISVWCVYVGNNSCGRNNGGCSHLCLYRPTGHVCVCPPHVTCSESWSLSVCLSVCHTWYMYYQSVSIVVLSRSMRVRHDRYVLFVLCFRCESVWRRTPITVSLSVCLSVSLTVCPSVRLSVLSA